MINFVKLLKNYLDYKNLEKFINTEKQNKQLSDSILPLILSQVASFVTLVGSAVVGGFFPTEYSLMPETADYLLYLWLAVLGIPFFYVFSGIAFALSKIFAGKGKFTEQTYLLAIIAFVANTIVLPLSILSPIPLIGLVTSIAVIVLSLYYLYAQYKILKTIHELSTLISAAIMFILYMLTAIFVFILSLALVPATVV